MTKTPTPLEVTILLRRALFKKITEEWIEKWSVAHGSRMPEITLIYRKNAFLEDLLLDMEEILRQRLGYEKASNLLISKDSLRRVLNELYKATLHEKTRNALAVYLGNESVDDFLKKNKNT
jgi:hypothetical protein